MPDKILLTTLPHTDSKTFGKAKYEFELEMPWIVFSFCIKLQSLWKKILEIQGNCHVLQIDMIRKMSMDIKFKSHISRSLDKVNIGFVMVKIFSSVASDPKDKFPQDLKSHCMRTFNTEQHVGYLKHSLLSGNILECPA